MLQTLTVVHIQCFVNPIDDNYQRLDQEIERMYPYNDHKRYEGASRYVTRFGFIHCSDQLQKQQKRCKYQTRKEIAVLTERNYIDLGQEYGMNNILEDDDMFDQAQFFDYYFNEI